MPESPRSERHGIGHHADDEGSVDAERPVDDQASAEIDPVAAGDDAAGHAGRHPYTRSGGRGQTIALIVFAVLLTAAVGWFALERQQQNKGQAALHSWDDPVNGVMPVTIEVDRDSDTALTCELIAVDDRQIIVGQLDLEIPAGGDRKQRIDAEIPLRGDGIAPELIGCSIDN